MDIRFTQLSAEAQKYVVENNVDGGKRGVIEEGNGELQTLLNGLGKTDATELLADTVTVNPATSRRASNGTTPTKEQLEQHFNSKTPDQRATIVSESLNDVSSRLVTIDQNIENAYNEVLGLQQIIQPLYESGSENATIETELQDILAKLGDGSVDAVPASPKTLLKLALEALTKQKNEALDKLRETIQNEIKSYDPVYVRPTMIGGQRIIPELEDAINTVTMKLLDIVADSIVEQTFNMSIDEFAASCVNLSVDELKIKLEQFVAALEENVAKIVNEEISPAVSEIRQKMTENIGKTSFSIMQSAINGDLKIPNPIEKTPTSMVYAKIDGTYVEGNLDTSDPEAIYTFLGKVSDDYQSSISGVETPTVEVNGQTYVVGKKYIEDTPTGKRIVTYDRLGNKRDISHGGIKVND